MLVLNKFLKKTNKKDQNKEINVMTKMITASRLYI